MGGGGEVSGGGEVGGRGEPGGRGELGGGGEVTGRGDGDLRTVVEFRAPLAAINELAGTLR